MKLQRLRGRKTCEYLLRKGRTWKGKHMTIRWLSGIPKKEDREGIYVGTMASKKLHKSAVKRNRMRRRCREALRKTLKEERKLSSAQLLLAPRSSSLDCSHADIVSDIRSFLSQL